MKLLYPKLGSVWNYCILSWGVYETIVFLVTKCMKLKPTLGLLIVGLGLNGGSAGRIIDWFSFEDKPPGIFYNSVLHFIFRFSNFQYFLPNPRLCSLSLSWFSNKKMFGPTSTAPTIYYKTFFSLMGFLKNHLHFLHANDKLKFHISWDSSCLM